MKFCQKTQIFSAIREIAYLPPKEKKKKQENKTTGRLKRDAVGLFFTAWDNCLEKIMSFNVNNFLFTSTVLGDDIESI